MKEKTISLQANTIAYLDNEKKGAATLLFIHGNSACKELFHHQYLSPDFSDFRLVAIDLPGHGQSSKDTNPSNYSLIHFADLILAFIEKLKLEKVILIGHSLGGHAALEAMESVNKNIIGLFIFNTPPVSSLNDLGSALPPCDYSPIALEPNPSDSAALVCAKGMAPGASRVDVERIALQLQKTDPDFRSSFLNTVIQQIFRNEVQILRNLSIPVIVAISAEDKLMSTTYVKNLPFPISAEQNYLELKGHHYVHLENPAYFNQNLSQFVQHCLSTT